MTLWPTETSHWGDEQTIPAITSGSSAVIRLLRVEWPAPVSASVRGWVVRRPSAPPASVEWTLRLGIGRVVIPLLHSAPIPTELANGTYRAINGANLTQILSPCRTVEVVARIVATSGDLAPGDVRVAAAVTPGHSIVWPQQGGCE